MTWFSYRPALHEAPISNYNYVISALTSGSDHARIMAERWPTAELPSGSHSDSAAEDILGDGE